MKKIIASIFLLMAVFSFGQTKEINHLIRIINKARLTENYLADYIRISQELIKMPNNDNSILYADFFRQRLPLIYIDVFGKNTSLENYKEVLSTSYITNYLQTTNQILSLEQNSGNYILTDKIANEKESLFLILNNFAVILQENNKNKQAAQIFFNLAMYETQQIDNKIEIFKTTNSNEYKQLEIERTNIYNKTLVNLEKAYALDTENIQNRVLLKKAYHVLKMLEKINTIND